MKLPKRRVSQDFITFCLSVTEAQFSCRKPLGALARLEELNVHLYLPCS